jgi:hypothetical protein
MKRKETAAAKREAGVSAVRLNLEQDEWLRMAFSDFLAEGPVFSGILEGPWALEAMEHDLADCLVRRARTFRTPTPGENTEEETEPGYREVVFRLDEGWLLVQRSWAHLYGRDPAWTDRVADGLIATYRRARKPAQPTFCLIKQTSCGIETEEIPLQEGALMSEEELGLVYGADFPEWHEAFLENFQERATGITILEGPPGTGKTSYIRQLMRVLRPSHRFYFIPSANFDVLRESEFVDFWAGERRRSEGRQLVVILEDAEAVLVPRQDDNRKEVSVLLNITDGILGEFLRLQVIATVNCGLDELDQALLRPGRLVARRHFGKMPVKQARAVAEAKGIDWAEDDEVSLAELFGGSKGECLPKRRRIGFEMAREKTDES